MKGSGECYFVLVAVNGAVIPWGLQVSGRGGAGRGRAGQVLSLVEPSVVECQESTQKLNFLSIFDQF